MKRLGGGFPCTLGSSIIFRDGNSRDEAIKTYHQHEFKTLEAWKELELSAYARLAFRILTMIPKENIDQVGKNIAGKKTTNEAEKVLNLPVNPSCQSDQLSLAFLIAFMVNCLEEHNYFDKTIEMDVVIDILLRSLLVSAKYGQKAFFGNPPASEAELWKVQKFPTKDFALGIYPGFSQMKNISQSKANQGIGPDVVAFFQDNKMFVQAIRKVKSGATVDLHWENEAKIDSQLKDIINFKCEGANCTLSFPLKDKTEEKIIKCPLGNCGVETNIWKRRKRIVELKRDHETARKELESKKERSAIHFLSDLIDEWDSMIFRPYKEVQGLEDDLKKAILLNNENMEREWLHSNK